MRGSFRLGRIAGIAIGIHYSWILIFLLVATTLALGFFSEYVRSDAAGVYWLAGIVAALALFASVLVHELAHSLVAQARGIPVRSITLFIFGGVSNLEQEAEKPGAEFAMAIVGPVTSLLLALIFLALYRLSEGGAIGNPISFPARSYPNVFAATLHYLAFINGLLAAFNILPGFPLDGGRVLRSIIWGASGNLVRATNIAATVGRLFGWSLIAIGVYWIFSGNPIGGIWIGFIGWFLSNAADASRREVTLREQLSGVKVRDAMVQYQDSVAPRTTVDELVRGILSKRFHRAVPVCDGTDTVGIVSMSDIKGVPQEKWPTTLVESIMTRAPLYSVEPDDDLNVAMRLIAQHDLNQVLVMSSGQCAGLLSRAEIIRYLQLAQELHIGKSQGR
jgi:Zn-dependent protease/CBS domain-containing protein